MSPKGLLVTFQVHFYSVLLSNEVASIIWIKFNFVYNLNHHDAKLQCGGDTMLQEFSCSAEHDVVGGTEHKEILFNKLRINNPYLYRYIIFYYGMNI